MNEQIKPRSEAEQIVDLLRNLPDHWSIMRVSKMGGESWRIYDKPPHPVLIEEHGDLLTALNLALT